jgi:hypothetical protein
MAPKGSHDSRDRKLVKITPRVSARDLKIRLAERDRRLAADNRTEAQKWLGDPPADRSALSARRGKVKRPAGRRPGGFGLTTGKQYLYRPPKMRRPNDIVTKKTC